MSKLKISIKEKITGYIKNNAAQDLLDDDLGHDPVWNRR